jgi:probable F420-dependent oxidoreductase
MPGIDADPRVALDEVRHADEVGLSAVWIAEKYDTKDLPSLAGAIGVASPRLQIGAGVTHVGLRHPLTIASMGQTLQAISGGRFRLGFGRSAPPKWAAAGVPSPTLQSFADIADVLGRLWSGQKVSYDGPLGCFPSMRIGVLDGVAPPPVYLAAVGPRTLELAGRQFDGVILHPFLSPDAVARSVDIARSARDAAGRSAEDFRVVAAVVVAPEGDEATQMSTVRKRAIRYFGAPTVADALMAANGWDASQLAMTEASNGRRTTVMPDRWLTGAAAMGTTADRVARLDAFVAAGADEVILHGGTVFELERVARAVGEAR